MQQRCAGPDPVELTAPSHILKAHPVECDALACTLAGEPHYFGGCIKGDNIIATLGEGERVPSHATSGIENAPTRTHVAEEPVVHGREVGISRLRREACCMPVVVGDRVSHRISLRPPPLLAATRGPGRRGRYVAGLAERRSAPRPLPRSTA